MLSPTCCSSCTSVSTLPGSMSVTFDRQIEAQTNLRKSLRLTPQYRACNSSPASMQGAGKSHSHQCCKMIQSPGNTDKMASLLCHSCLICRSIAPILPAIRGSTRWLWVKKPSGGSIKLPELSVGDCIRTPKYLNFSAITTKRE